MGKPFAESITDFSGLLNTADAPHEVAENEAVLAQNVVAAGKGKVQKRYGYDQVSSGGSATDGVRGLLPFRRLIGERKYLLIFNNGRCYTITNEDTTWRDRGAYGTDAGERVNGAISSNIAIFGNGNSANVVKKLDEVVDHEDTTGASTDTIATSIAEGATERQTLTALTAGEDMTSIEVKIDNKGTGDWTVTLHDVSNVALATSTVKNALLTNGAFNTFTFSTPYTTDGTVHHFHVTSTVADGVAVSGTLNDLEDVLFKVNVLEVATLGGSPPNASQFETYKGFPLLSGITLSPTLFYWPDTEAPESWSSGVAGNEAVNLNDGQKITRMISFGSAESADAIVVFKERAKFGVSPVFASSITTLADGDELGFRQNELSDKSGGTFAGNSVVPIGKQGIMFLGEDKFQSYGFVENYPGARLPENLSEKIAPTVRTINKEQVHKAVAIHDEFDNKYRCAVPVGINTKNSVEFIYDLKFSSWSINTGLAIAYYAIFEDDDGERRVYFGSEHSGKLFRFNKRFSDNFDNTAGTGEAIDAIWRSRTFRPGNSKLSKKNRFDTVVLTGAITNPFTGTFTIVVKNRRSSEQHSVEITEADILGVGSVTGYVGDEYVGLGYVGGGGTPGDEPEMFHFQKEIPFPDNVREGSEVYFVMRNNNDQEGFRLEEIFFYGEDLVGKPLTPAV